MNKIIKGFVDKQGNRVEVEGAGTDYNEGKNSVAIGNGTKAIGEDQFVFGRRNATATNKAEIVGGGALYELGDVVVPANVEREEEAMIYAGHSLEEFRAFLHMTYGVTPEDVVIADENRTVTGINGQGQSVSFNVPNVSEYSNLAFVVFERAIDASNFSLYVYGYDFEHEIIFQPLSELQGHFYGHVVDGEKSFTEQGMSYITDGDMTLRGAVGNPGIGLAYFSTAGNFYKSFVALREKNIRTLDWEGNESIDGDLTVGGNVTAGGDVTCSDGEGGTISMRALAEAVATLQAAAGGTSEETPSEEEQ